MHEVNASNRVDTCSGNNLQPMLFAIHCKLPVLYGIHTHCMTMHHFPMIGLPKLHCTVCTHHSTCYLGDKRLKIFLCNVKAICDFNLGTVPIFV